MEDEQGRGRPVSGRYLGTLLHDHRSLRLVLLDSCEGARTLRSDPFAGAAQSLVRQGIPAVIAMQFEITDEAAITMSHEFYAALADGYPADGALADLRPDYADAAGKLDEAKRRMFRGGSWTNLASNVHSAYRYIGDQGFGPEQVSVNLGFRVVMPPEALGRFGGP